MTPMPIQTLSFLEACSCSIMLLISDMTITLLTPQASSHFINKMQVLAIPSKISTPILKLNHVVVILNANH